MSPRIDSLSIPHTYFSAQNTSPAAAPSRPSAWSCAVRHPVRSGGQNLQRFFAMGCFGGGRALSLDVSTEEGWANYKLAVRAWAARPLPVYPEFRARQDIADRIDLWLEANDPGATLDLSNSTLRSLPPLPANLQSLNISNAFDTEGPGQYPKTWPAGLRELNISKNNLSNLPDNLPDTLTSLDAATCSLKRLPKLPRSLEMLHVAGNELDALPDMPPGLRGLDARSNKIRGVSAALPGTLTKLYLSNNPLRVVPRLPDGLTHLHLDGAGLRNLPSLPRELVELSVQDNVLMRLDHVLPSGLKILVASDNPLMELPILPDGLERLSVNSTLVSQLPAVLPANLGYLNISHTQITALSDDLRLAAARPDSPLSLVADELTLVGAGIATTYGVRIASLSLSQAVNAWYGGPDAGRGAAWDRIYRDAQDGLANATVPLWKLLDSLRRTAEHPSEAGDTDQTRPARSEMRTAFKQRVTDLLDAIGSDADLRKTCLEIAHERVDSCHDNISLGFDEMEQAHLAARATKGEFPQDELFAMGQGRLKLLLLDELAIPKGNAVALDVAAETGRRPDQVLDTVEVVLAYRLALAERLDLPTKTKNMLFYTTARVTEQDLAEVEAKVKAAVADDGRVASFMAGWRPWQAELERRHPEEFSPQALDVAKDRLRSGMDAAQEDYDKACEEEGEFSDKALNALAELNGFLPKFDALEEVTFVEARERLTKTYMGMS